ncbi:MAG: ParB/RepB/Spo0J family partition protein [Actinomycetota bacterium]|nr:ParB/RepB/Spo0J family partition protein [Actinomycetota bacterium]
MPRKSGLGRGLEALLPEKTDTGSGGPDRIPVDQIDPNPRQPRDTFDPSALGELAASIRELGILQPVLVRALPTGRYELVAGERRLRAARSAGLTEIPALVVETDERGSLERALVENIHREDLNPIEEAAGLKQLLEEGGLTQEALGQRIGRTRGAISNTLRLLELPTSVQKMLIDRKLTAGHGRALLGLASPAFQERLARRVEAEGLTVRQTEDVVRRYAGYSGAGASSGQARERPAAITEAQHRLAEHLQTRVRVELGKRKGKIVLDFVSLEELDRLLGVITGPTIRQPD